MLLNLVKCLNKSQKKNAITLKALYSFYISSMSARLGKSRFEYRELFIFSKIFKDSCNYVMMYVDIFANNVNE